MIRPSRYEEPILRSLRRITRAIDLHSRRLESQYGLTGPQLLRIRCRSVREMRLANAMCRAVEIATEAVPHGR